MNTLQHKIIYNYKLCFSCIFANRIPITPTVLWCNPHRPTDIYFYVQHVLQIKDDAANIYGKAKALCQFFPFMKILKVRHLRKTPSLSIHHLDNYELENEFKMNFELEL